MTNLCSLELSLGFIFCKLSIYNKVSTLDGSFEIVSKFQILAYNKKTEFSFYKIFQIIQLSILQIFLSGTVSGNIMNSNEVIMASKN